MTEASAHSFSGNRSSDNEQQSQKSMDSVNNIIAKVMGRIARKSRRTQINQSPQRETDRFLINPNTSRSKGNKIVEVNERLENENKDLRNRINLLEKKYMNLSKKQKMASYNKVAQESKKNQLANLKRRLLRAESVAVRIENQISQTNQKNQKNKQRSKKRQKNNDLKICLKTDERSPSKSKCEYYSPIVQFEQYHLDSMYEKSPDKKRQYRSRKEESKALQHKNYSCQVQLGYQELYSEETQLNEMIANFERCIRENNTEIARLQSSLAPFPNQ